MGLKDWHPCSVSPSQGLALFDGITIEADSILYKGTDRVMPLFEEEQILMCRLMAQSIPENTMVLDVGTGSGVFAIYAASKRRCRVLGIDVSPRAIEFARRNAEQNGVRLRPRWDLLKSGEVCFWECSFDTFVKRARSGNKFSVILLNPPFNPTFPLINPALHARGGIDGQAPFRKQMAHVPEMQDVGDICIGYQMSYDGLSDQPGALMTIYESYRHKCSVRFSHVLAGRRFISASTFLRKQYMSLYRSPAEAGLRAQLDQYIMSVGKRDQRFSLIYYEVTKEGVISSGPPVEMKLKGLPDRTWRDRIWLHKIIVESAYEC